MELAALKLSELSCKIKTSILYEHVHTHTQTHTDRQTDKERNKHTLAFTHNYDQFVFRHIFVRCHDNDISVGDGGRDCDQHLQPRHEDATSAGLAEEVHPGVDVQGSASGA